MRVSNDWLSSGTTKNSLKSLYRAFTSNTFECFIRTDSTGVIILSNSLFAKTFNYRFPRLARGENFFTHFLHEKELSELRVRLYHDLIIRSVKVHLITSSGKEITALINVRANMDQSGHEVIDWTFIDISHTVEFEVELTQKKRELEKVNDMMEKFLYSTSHDLRSPVTSILGLVHLMKIETRDAVLNDYIDKVEQCAGKLDLIIRDLMGFSKTSYQRSRSSRIDLRNLITETIGKYSRDTNFNLLFFEVNLTDTLSFYSDPERVEIILDNIIRNTVHFCDVGKARSIVRISANVTLEEAIIEIHDNGIGIGKPHHEPIFHMFYKASNLSRGAGLGLYIAKESLQQLNGSITVESELGFGSIFRIRIPNDDKGKLVSKKILLSLSGENSTS